MLKDRLKRSEAVVANADAIALLREGRYIQNSEGRLVASFALCDVIGRSVVSVEGNFVQKG